MNIEYLTQLLDNKLKTLANAKDQAFAVGDLASVNTIEQEILGVDNTLYSLRLMQQVSIVADSTNITPTQLIQNGINATENAPVLLVDATSPMSKYDITSYATDPLHEQKIADILNYMGEMNSPADVDIYIDSEAISSPVTGQMIFNSALKYNVDIRLMMALMELDSRFGTAGVAIRTLNPGNVGNDDSGETKTFASWEEGVDAVANWLNNHRIKDNILIEDTPTEKPVVNIEEDKITDNHFDLVLPEENIVPVSQSTIEPVIDIPKEESIPASDPISKLKQVKKVA